MAQNPTSLQRRPVALIIAALVVFGAASCGSSGSKSDSSNTPVAGGATENGGSTDGSSDTKPAKVDPCQWYTAEEMSTLVGFTVTMEKRDTPIDLGSECLYDNQKEFASVVVRPGTAAMYDELKSGAATYNPDGTQIDLAGVGDEAYHNAAPDATNPSVALSAKKGAKSINVEIAAAAGGGFKDEGNANTIKIASTIATKALG